MKRNLIGTQNTQGFSYIKYLLIDWVFSSIRMLYEPFKFSFYFSVLFAFHMASFLPLVGRYFTTFFQIL